MAKKDDLISYREMNRLMKDQPIPRPESDSPGDTAEDEMAETFLGTNYPESEKPADNVPADLAAELEDENDDSAKHSRRPNPIHDLDRPTSIH